MISLVTANVLQEGFQAAAHIKMARITPIELNPDFLTQYANIKKIQDLIGVELIQLLAFWDDISTAGEISLYSTLFLTHNLLGIDAVFKADANDNILVSSTKIKDHVPIVMAALRITQGELQKVLDHTRLAGSELTLGAISKTYRYTLLAKSLSTKPSSPNTPPNGPAPPLPS